MKKLFLILLFCSVAMPSYAVDYTQDANCQGAWLMDIDEDPLTDSSQNNNTGALKGAGEPNFATANPPKAYSIGYYVFDGNDDEVDCGNDQSLFADPFSWSVWVKVNTETNQALMVKWANTGTNQILFIDANKKIVGRIARNNNEKSTVISTTVVVSGTWYHVVWYGTLTGNEAKLYVDGSLEDTDTVGDLYTGTVGTLDFGKGGWDDSAIESRTFDYFDGSLDEVAMFDRELILAEVNDIMDNGLEGAAAVAGGQVIMIY